MIDVNEELSKVVDSVPFKGSRYVPIPELPFGKAIMKRFPLEPGRDGVPLDVMDVPLMYCCKCEHVPTKHSRQKDSPRYHCYSGCHFIPVDVVVEASKRYRTECQGAIACSILCENVLQRKDCKCPEPQQGHNAEQVKASENIAQVLRPSQYDGG